jgi:hypothetical protein
MSDDHPSDDDVNWYAKERARTTYDSQRSRTARSFSVINGGLSEESTAQYLALVKKRDEQREQDARANRAQVERVRGLVQRIKSCSEPRKQISLVSELRDAGHPDVDGLLQTLESRTSGTTRPRKDKPL